MLDKKINTLLFTHDCVIVPGLGGFVASPAAAKHNRVRHTFIPPVRVIAFNVFLRQNDGLLANFISTEEKIPFSEAMKAIERYVERCFMEMEAGRKVTVADIGLLYYDTEKNIQFSPDETAMHSLDAFGLVPLRAVPVATDSKRDFLLAPLRTSSKKERRAMEGMRKKPGRSIAGGRLVNAGLIVGVLLWAMFNVYIIAPKNFNLSALNPFEKTVPEPERIRPVPVDSLKPEEPPKNIPAPAPTIQPVVPVEEKVTSEPSAKKIKEENIPVTVKKIVPEANGRYFTVVGVFNVPSNAENMLAKLRASGYPGCGSIERENKPTIIYAAQHVQKTDAMESLQRLKEQGLEAWILTR